MNNDQLSIQKLLRMLEYILLGVSVLFFVLLLLFFISEHRSLGSDAIDSISNVPDARRSKRTARKLLKKAQKKNSNIGRMELTEEYSVFRNEKPMWRSYYASPVSKRRKYKPGRG